MPAGWIPLRRRRIERELDLRVHGDGPESEEAGDRAPRPWTPPGGSPSHQVIQAGKHCAEQDADNRQTEGHADPLAAKARQSTQRKLRLVFFAASGGRFAFEVNGPFDHRNIKNVHVGRDDETNYDAHDQGGREDPFHSATPMMLKTDGYWPSEQSERLNRVNRSVGFTGSPPDALLSVNA